MKAEKEAQPQRALIIDPAIKVAGEVQAFLDELGGWDFIGATQEWGEGPAAVEERRPAVVFVNLDAGPEEALETAAQVVSLSPQSVLLGLSEMGKDQGGDWLIRGVRAGFRDFLKFPLDGDEVAAALSRVERALGVDRRQRGKVVTLFSPRGGSGLTTLAVNLGIILAKQGKKTVGLIDLDLELGDVSFFLNLSPAITIADLANRTTPLERKVLKEALVPHASGVEVLAPPLEVQQAEEVSEQGVYQVIQAMRELFDFVLIDTAHNFSPTTIKALDSSDVILLLTLPHLAAIADAKRTLEVFSRLGYEKRLRLVVSRISPADDVSTEEVEKALQLPVFMAFPSDYRQVVPTINRGLSLWEYAPRSQVTRAILGLAQKLSGTTEAKDGKRRKEKRRFHLF